MGLAVRPDERGQLATQHRLAGAGAGAVDAVEGDDDPASRPQPDDGCRELAEHRGSPAGRRRGDERVEAARRHPRRRQPTVTDGAPADSSSIGSPISSASPRASS